MAYIWKGRRIAQSKNWNQSEFVALGACGTTLIWVLQAAAYGQMARCRSQ